MINYRPKVFDEASKSHASKKLYAILLAFIVVMGIILILESIIPAIVSTKPMLEEMNENGYLENPDNFNFQESMKLAMKVSSSPSAMIPTLLSTIFGTVTAIFYCRCIEMRPVRSMGARKEGFFSHYITGIITGIILMSAITLLSVALGVNKIEICHGVNYKVIALYLLGFIVQGMSEEFIFRGYLMTTIGGAGYHTGIAVMISAVAFALAHAANPGFGVVPFINLTLFGVFAALHVVVFDNIWGICAIHSIWNFTQGNFYGISVSGSNNTESVFRTTAVSDKAFLTGGEFGIEGSIFTTLILSIVIASSIYLIYKRQQLQQKKQPSQE